MPVQHISRRQSLKRLTAGSAIATLTARLSSAVFAAGSDSLKIGLVGCGGRGSGAVFNAMNADPTAKLTAMADLFPDRLEMAYQNLARRNAEQVDVPQSRRFTGFEAYRSLLQTDVDLVVLATPPGFRPKHFADSVNAGKHVFMEKPVAVDAPGIRQILETAKAAKERNLGVQCGFQRRHDVGYREAIRRIQDGQLGRIQSLEADWRTGGVWTRLRTAGQSELEYQLRNWYYFVWQSGDFIVEQHSQNLDVCIWLMGGPPAKAEPVKAGREVRTGYKAGEIFDEFVTRFTWGGSPLGANISLKSTARQILNHPDGYKVGEMVRCTEGVADLAKGQFENFSGSVLWRNTERGMAGFQEEWDHFIAAIKGGQMPNEAEAAAYSTLTSIMGRMAGYSGESVTWEQALNSREAYFPSGTLSFNSPPPSLPDKFGDYVVPARGKTV